MLFICECGTSVHISTIPGLPVPKQCSTCRGSTFNGWFQRTYNQTWQDARPYMHEENVRNQYSTWCQKQNRTPVWDTESQ